MAPSADGVDSYVLVLLFNSADEGSQNETFCTSIVIYCATKRYIKLIVIILRIESLSIILYSYYTLKCIWYRSQSCMYSVIKEQAALKQSGEVPQVVSKYYSVMKITYVIVNNKINSLVTLDFVYTE